MLNSVESNCTFQAKLKTDIKLKNKAKFKEVSEIFKKKTESSPNEVLYITEAKYEDGISVHTSNQKCGDFYKGCEIILNTNIDEQLQKLSPEKFAKKLLNAFKLIKHSDSTTAEKSVIVDNIIQNEKKYNKNTKIANVLRKYNKIDFAKNYELFAQFNKDKIHKMKTKLKHIEEKFINLKNKLTKEFPELHDADI